MSVQSYRQLLEFVLKRENRFEKFKYIYNTFFLESYLILSPSLTLDVFLNMMCTDRNIIMLALEVFILFPDIFEIESETIQTMWKTSDLDMEIPTRDELENMYRKKLVGIRENLPHLKEDLKLEPVYKTPVTLEMIMTRLGEMSRQNQELYQQNVELRSLVGHLRREVYEMKSASKYRVIF